MERCVSGPKTRRLPRVLEYDLLIEHGAHRLRIHGTEEALIAEPHSLRSAWHFLQLLLRHRRRLAKIPALKIYWKRIRIW